MYMDLLLYYNIKFVRMSKNYNTAAYNTIKAYDNWYVYKEVET